MAIPQVEMVWDDWQKDFLKTEGDKILCTGRQVGKSEVCSADATEWAIRNPNKDVLIIAPTERQAYALFEKTLSYIALKYPKEIKLGKDKPTKHKITLKNKTRIHCLPTGTAGTGIRFLTSHRLYIDEASRVPDEVWNAVTPMLLTTGGATIMLSTPAGAKGFFYKCWINEDHAYDSFKRFSITSEVVIKERAFSPLWTEQRREGAIRHIEREKKRMSSREFAQEYLGEFLQDLHQLFPDYLISKCCTGNRREKAFNYKFYLGVDIARLGEDETTYEIIGKKDQKFIHFDSIVKTKQLTTKTEQDIIELHRQWKFKNIGIDAGSGSLGVGVFDHLINEKATKNYVIPINNRQLALDPDGKKSQRLLKEDLYNNLLGLMQRNEIELLYDDEVIASLKSVQYEYVQDPFKPPRLRIFGNYTHIAEGIIRAAWLAKKDKTLNLWASSISIVRKQIE